MPDPDILPGLEDLMAYRTEFDLREGDCVEGMKTLPDASIDLVVTSPPYNLGIAYAKYDDSLGREDYLAWSLSWAAEVRRVLKEDGAFFLNVGASPANPWMPHELALKLRDLFELQNTIHWIKSITVDDRNGETHSVGHFKPINSKRFLNDCHEFVFHFTKTGKVPLDRLAVGVPYAHKSNIGRWSHTGGNDRRCRGNNWFIPYETIVSRNRDRPHPATFPVELARKCIALHGSAPEETTMMDPFLGIGHAAAAAGDCGVAKFIGFDIDESYLAEARDRVANKGG
ncbi:MAG: site-specific DNA-methyltransferase [Verrucomicrobiales bacterium]